MGNTCTPLADSCQCMAKTTWPPIKINKFKKRSRVEQEGIDSEDEHKDTMILTSNLCVPDPMLKTSRHCLILYLQSPSQVNTIYYLHDTDEKVRP